MQHPKAIPMGVVIGVGEIMRCGHACYCHGGRQDVTSGGFHQMPLLD